MNRSERFIMAVDYIIKKKGSRIRGYKDMSVILGVSPSLLTEIKMGRSEVGIKALEGLVTNFQFVNANWILTGEGDMVALSKSEISTNDFTSDLAEKYEKYRKLLREIHLLTDI